VSSKEGRIAADRIDYSGMGDLTQALELSGGFDSSRPGILLRRLELISSAMQTGAPLADSLDALGLLLVELERSIDDSESWTSEQLRVLWGALSADVVKQFGAMLAGTGQWTLSGLMDRCWLLQLERGDSSGLLGDSLLFLRGLATGGPHTLSRFVPSRFTEQYGERTAELVEALDRAVPLVQDEGLLARLRQAECEFGVQYARATARCSDDEVEIISRLEMLAAELTLRFGGEVFCAEWSSADDAWKQQMLAERQELLTQLESLAAQRPTDAWTHGFLAFVRGRILIGTGALDQGVDAFLEAFNLGFAPWLTGLQLAFACSRLRRPQEVLAWVERVADCCFLERGELETRSETMARLYYQAGGKPANVGSGQWPVVAALLEKNREAMESLTEALGQEAITAQSHFFARCLVEAERFLGRSLSPSDVDRYLGESDAAEQMVRLERAEASRLHLDELPLLRIEPSLLARFVDLGGPTGELVEALIQHYQESLVQGRSASELLESLGCLAGSERFIRAQVEDSLVDSVAEACEFLKAVAVAGHVSQETLLEIFALLREQASARGDTEEADKLGQWLSGRMQGDQRNRLLQGVIPGLFGRLQAQTANADRIDLLDQILEAGGDEESTHEELAAWVEGVCRDDDGEVSGGRHCVDLLEAVAPRLRFQAGRRVRSLLVDALFQRLAAMEWSWEITKAVENLLTFCVGNPVLEERLVRWFVGSAYGLRASEGVLPFLDVSETLLRRLSMVSAAGVRDGVERVAQQVVDLAFPHDLAGVKERVAQIAPRGSSFAGTSLSAARWAGWITALVLAIAFGAFAVWKSSGSAVDAIEEPDAAALLESAQDSPSQAEPSEGKSGGAVASAEGVTMRQCSPVQLPISQDGRYVTMRGYDVAAGWEAILLLDLSALKAGGNALLLREEASKWKSAPGDSALAGRSMALGVGNRCLDPMEGQPDFRVNLRDSEGRCMVDFMRADKVLHQGEVKGLGKPSHLCSGRLPAVWRWYYLAEQDVFLVQLAIEAYGVDGEWVALWNSFAFVGVD